MSIFLCFVLHYIMLMEFTSSASPTVLFPYSLAGPDQRYFVPSMCLSLRCNQENEKEENEELRN